MPGRSEVSIKQVIKKKKALCRGNLAIKTLQCAVVHICSEQMTGLTIIYTMLKKRPSKVIRLCIK